jgi:hypothetical protein
MAGIVTLLAIQLLLALADKVEFQQVLLVVDMSEMAAGMAAAYLVT